jgi:hypothetical protein
MIEYHFETPGDDWSEEDRTK